MAAPRILPLFLGALFCLTAGSTSALAMAPSGEEWFTIESKHLRVHHTLPLEPYARAATQAFERALPELEKRLNWRAPETIDVIVMDPTDSANGLTMNFPNNAIELFASPFGADSPLAFYENWANEIAVHELTHMVANDTTLGLYTPLRAVFGSWVKPNGLQPVWLSEGLAVFEETSLTGAGRGRSPLLEALLREAVVQHKLDSPDYTSLDRFNDGVPWWPAGNTQYLLGYVIQALPSKRLPNLPGKVSHENASTWIFAPDRVLRAVTGGTSWADVWSGAEAKLLNERYLGKSGPDLRCRLTHSGRFTGGHALSADGWIYFSEEDWDHGFHLARVRADAPCDKGVVERLERKNYSGPTQVAVSPSGKTVAFAALDPGYETEFSDVYLWSESGGTRRVTKDERVRDPAFADETTLLFVKANADTGESIVKRDLATGAETVLWTSRALERASGLFARGRHVLFSLHTNDGHEKVVELRGGQAYPLVKTVDASREFERNPFLASDGTLYFSASYGHGPLAIYRLDPASKGAVRVQTSASGYLDRPVPLADGRTLVAQDYGLGGLDLARFTLAFPSTDADPKAGEPKEDLHEYLTDEKPRAIAGPPAALPASVPYSLSTSATSLWPHYWFPSFGGAQDGFYAGASTSGNDALNYHRWFVSAAYDSRARFPVYLAYYHDRTYTTNFHFQAMQLNNYFPSRKESDREATYSVEATVPVWDFVLAFGSAYRQKQYAGAMANNGLVYQDISIDRSGATPSAIAPNWGASFNNFTALFPSTSRESTFVDVRPELKAYQRGFHPSHSVSVALSGGISTNRYPSSNYYQGGGASPLSPSSFVVRGYPTDVLFGQRVATGNVAYTLPLAHVYHGLGTNPFFLDAIGLRFLGDAGSANYMALYDGKTLLGYEYRPLGKRVLYGSGADLLFNGTLFYHVPVTLTLGGHYGFQKRYGGGWLGYFALGVNLNTGALRPSLAGSRARM